LMIYVLQKLIYIRDDYNKILAVWILSLIIVQMFINIWVNLKILPNTWLTLPFISHGWSALMVNLIELIILYKIIENK
jgi:cell division protein FtsW (lipid II flippase)